MSGTILVVEDERIIAEDLRLRLQQMEYEVTGPVGTGAEAIAAARMNPPTLVVMDVLLRGPMDGIGAARNILREQDIPVLFVTACSDDDTLSRAREIPGSLTLIKPIDDRELSLGIELVLARKQVRMLQSGSVPAGRTPSYAEILGRLAGLSVMGIDSSGAIDFASPPARKLLGVPEDKVFRVSLQDVVSLSNGQSLPVLLARLHETGYYRCECEAGRIDEHARWIQLTFLPGSGEGSLVFCEDVSERRLSEVKQRALYLVSKAAHDVGGLEDLYRSIHRTVNEVISAENFYIALHDRNSGLLSFPYFVDAHDSTPDPVPLGKGLTEYVLKTGEPLLVTPETFDTLCSSGDVESIGEPSVDWLGVPLQLDGKTFGVLVVQSYSRNTRYSAGDMDLLSFVSHQIAMAIDRTQKEEILRRSESELRSLINSIDDVVILFNAEGRHLDIAPTNPSRLFRPADQLVGRLLQDTLPRALADSFLKKIREALVARRRLTFEYAMDIEGDKRWFDGTLTPAGDDRVLLVARDISARKHIEDSLRQAEETYKGVFDNTSMGIAQRMVEGRFTSANPALIRMYDAASADDLLAEMTKRCGQLYHDPDRRQQIDTMLKEAGELTQVESQVERLTGGVFWIQESYKLVQTSDGKEPYYIVTVQDATQQKQAERELRLLANTVACAKDCFMLTDLDGVILFVNDAFVKTFGYGSEEIQGKTHLLLAGSHDLPEQVRNAFLPPQGMWNGELTLRRSNGVEFPAEVWTSLVSAEKGKPVACVTVARDITERKQSEQLIRNNELRLRRITDQMLDMVVQITTSGRCEYASPSVQKILGYNTECLRGKALLGMIHPSDRRRVFTEFQRMYREKNPGAIEYRVKHAHGHWVWLESIVNPLDSEGGTDGGFVAGSVDITDRKNAEDVLRLNEARLETLVTLHQMTDASTEQITGFALEEAVALTQSELGFLVFLNDAEDGVISHVWSRRARELAASPPELVASTPMVRSSIRQRQPIILNKPDPGIPLSIPAGHAAISRFMSVPVVETNRIVAIVGVGGKKEEYDSSDARQLTLLMEGMWMLVQRQRAEDKIRTSLDEKDVLLKEVHHRVKNNLQIISSLLNLQFGHNENAAVANLLRESQNRIRSMALIHERLYRSGDLMHVDFGHYVRNLISYLIRSYVGGERNISVDVKIENVLLGVDQAIPCGLIVNELVSNALRHAFAHGGGGVVTVTMAQSEGVCRMTISDNGVGIPFGVNVTNADTLGLQLVETLVEQIDGIRETVSNCGTAHHIVFRIK